MNHDEPDTWESWKVATRKRQAIITALAPVVHTQTKEHLAKPRPIIPPPTIRTTLPPLDDPKPTQRREGRCFLCNRQGHIQCECPEKMDTRPDPETMIAAKRTTATSPAKGQRGRSMLELVKELRCMNKVKQLRLGQKFLHLTRNRPATIARTSFI